MATVRVKVTSTNDVKVMSESAAKRLVQINSKEYRILETPKVDVINLPPLETVEPQKKSVIVADVEARKVTVNYIAKPEDAEKHDDSDLKDSRYVIEEKPKRGRPKANA